MWEVETFSDIYMSDILKLCDLYIPVRGRKAI